MVRVAFTKMQGAGNDFVVLDETRGPLGLTPAQYRWLADRHFGVGADQILSVRPAPAPEVDFAYVIHNADGAEVEQCGNGARCFARYVLDRGLTLRREIRVRTRGGDIAPRVNADGSVSVDMGAPRFAPADLPFLPELAATGCAQAEPDGRREWPLSGVDTASGAPVFVSVLSMGNPHAVLRVDDVQTAPVGDWGPRVERHPAFPQRVNVGFMQVVDRGAIRLRVWERGAGETLACGTGACAAAVAGMRLGLLDASVHVHARGGTLHIAWGGPGEPVWMTGPAVTVYHGEIDVPHLSQWPQ